MRRYVYKLTTDDGGAPCVVDGLLSLAICKPMIRRTAKPGDLIFGFAANSLHRDNRLIYIARVTEALPDGLYYRRRAYSGRRDRIYKWRSDGTFSLREDAQFHAPERDHLRHDLGAFPDYERADVLLSEDFRYFGPDCRVSLDTYPKLQSFVRKLGRGHGVKYSPELVIELDKLQKSIWRYKNPDPVRSSQQPSPRRSHRSRSCAVIDSRD